MWDVCAEENRYCTASPRVLRFRAVTRDYGDDDPTQANQDVGLAGTMHATPQPAPAPPAQMPQGSGHEARRTMFGMVAPQIGRPAGTPAPTPMATPRPPTSPMQQTTYGTPAPVVTQRPVTPAPPPQQPTPAPPPKHPTGGQVMSGANLAPGTKIDQYELIRELGRGGMGCVYAARDTKLGRRVAMKFLLNASRGVAERFLIEARATAQCQHDNIVIIHEVDEHEGMPYMVLEFLEGAPMHKGGGKLPASRVIELALPVARALEQAHGHGIVHRDLKPDNCFVTNAGQVKVLDFGIAKATGARDAKKVGAMMMDHSGIEDMGLTREGALVGTMPYMCPEQFGMDDVDHRADLWALGVMMFEMLAGKHPIDPLTPQKLITTAANLDEPMPGIRLVAPEVPDALARIVDGCLRKKKAERIATAADLVKLLEDLLPGKRGRQLGEGESPYPGLTAFQESDADRFFGRGRDVTRMVARVRENPLTAVIGPSGVGKSSFIRAGVGPALKQSGEAWDVVTLRPGRHPLAALASVVQSLTTRSGADLASSMQEHDQLLHRLRTEPGYLGTLLRSRARQLQGHILLFVDQFEELYTLVPDADERRAFTAALAGVADDTATPLRVVVSMRADFVDRVAEDPRFMEELQRGMVFLAAPDRAGLREALVSPVEMVGYRYERESMVEDMLTALEGTQGALPLLQFAAAKLWDARDRDRQVLSESSYQAIGGISGALATHADDVLAQMNATAQKLTQKIFQRLVTPERTRAIVELADLHALSPDKTEVARVLDQLVAARLLVVQTRGDAGGGSAEIVHESLIERWPTLQRWLEEDQEDAAFVSQLRTAAKQWETKGKAVGLLWRGEPMEEARRWYQRRPRELPQREQQYLDAVFALARRGTRNKRIGITAAFVVLGAIAAGALVAMVLVRGAQKEAEANAVKAKQEAERATSLMQTTQDALDKAEEKERQRLAAVEKEAAAKSDQQKAEQATEKANAQVAESAEELKRKNDELEGALEDAKKAQEAAEKAQKKAEAESKKAEDASAKLASTNDKLEEKLKAEREAREKAEEKLSKISTKLK